jgi:hypothetical protein
MRMGEKYYLGHQSMSHTPNKHHLNMRLITERKISLIYNVDLLNISQPTKRAPDAGESAAISGSFLRLIIFPVGRLRRPRPSAGNANR